MKIIFEGLAPTKLKFYLCLSFNFAHGSFQYFFLVFAATVIITSEYMDFLYVLCALLTIKNTHCAH